MDGDMGMDIDIDRDRGRGRGRGRGNSIFGALFSGTIEDIQIETKMTTEGKVIRIMTLDLLDEEGRNLSLSSRFIQPYKQIYVGMSAHTLVLSSSPNLETSLF